MAEPSGPQSAPPSIEELRADFLLILPRVEAHAQIHFRHVKCPGRRADALAEVIALSWKWYVRVISQGKDATEFVSTLADHAVRHVRSGRRLCGQERAKDVLSALAQQRHNFKVEMLTPTTRRSHESIYSDPHGQDHLDAFEQRLRDNTQSPVADQAAFRVDYPAWVAQLEPRNREIVRDMALDLRTGELAARHRISAARISQLRREFHLDWRLFHGEEA
jgi:hypothetical protein